MWLQRKLRDPLIWPAASALFIFGAICAVLASLGSELASIPFVGAFLAGIWLAIWIN